MDFDGSLEIPADQQLREWTLALPVRAGVFLLWGAGGEPILLATTGSVRAAVRRKLSEADQLANSRRTKLIAITKGLSWTQTNSNFVAYLQFHRLAREIYPANYRQMLGWSDPWWVRVCLSERYGRLLATRKIVPGTADEYIGPLPNSRAAKKLIDLGTDMFGLCRDCEILQQSSANKPTKACAYAQMGKCCGVCFGRVSADEYRAMLNKLAELAEPAGRLRQRRRLEDQMGRASQRLDFESAANNKKLIKRLDDLESSALQWTGRLGRFCYLVIAAGLDRHHVWPWRISGGLVEPREPIELGEVEERIDEVVDWAKAASYRPPVAPSEIQQWQETISLVSYFLFRSHSDKCLYYKLDDLPGTADMASQISTKFGSAKGAQSRGRGTIKTSMDLKSPAEGE